MIERAEYLKALEIVESYHQQIKRDVIEYSKCKTPIIKWGKWKECSQRLKGILFDIKTGSNYTNYKCEYIEDINIDAMKKFRRCGRKTINEFRELRGF